MNCLRHRLLLVSRVVSLLMSTLAVSSCTSVHDKTLAERGVTEFHRQLDSAQYHTIYAEADESIRKSNNEAEFTTFLRRVHEKLGNVRQSKFQTYSVGWSTGVGVSATLIYATDFANGKASETFVWRFSDSNALLLGYHIDSNALVIN
ncbi:MAG TPA: DUF4019 domain-containing protein [Candidatus Acidoferrales bacterium]